MMAGQHSIKSLVCQEKPRNQRIKDHPHARNALVKNSGAIAAIKKPDGKPKQGCWICGQYHWLSECTNLTEAEKNEVTARKRTEFAFSKLRSLSHADAKKWMGFL